MNNSIADYWARPYDQPHGGAQRSAFEAELSEYAGDDQLELWVSASAPDVRSSRLLLRRAGCVQLRHGTTL
jgi:hypothetical protein